MKITHIIIGIHIPELDPKYKEKEKTNRQTLEEAYNWALRQKGYCCIPVRWNEKTGLWERVQMQKVKKWWRFW